MTEKLFTGTLHKNQKKKKGTVRIAKTKALISCAVTVQLICVFVFAFAKRRFSHNAAQILMTTSKTITASAPYIQTRHNLVHVHILSDLHVLTCIAVMYMHSQVQPYKTDQTSVCMPRMSSRAHVINFRKKVKKKETQ